MENKKYKNINVTDPDPVTAITHYVRAPIYVLKSYLETILSGELGQLENEQKKYLRICLENVEKIGKTIEKLIYVMEIEDGKFKIQKKTIDVVDTVRKIVNENQFLARAANAKIFFTTEEESLFVMTDAGKIRDVFNAFINNAIKYREEGEGIIEINIKKRDSEVVCSIKDNGVGVSDEDKEKIFNKFYRTKKAIKIDPNSLGLDLYINKKIIDECGGKVWVEDNEGGGTVFCFTIFIS